MKAHIGVDAASGLVHTLIGTASNVSYVAQAHPCCMAMKPPRLVAQATKA